jgi:hypothetical protein
MEFNINDKVKVKLTDYGRAVHAADHDLLWVNNAVPRYIPPKEDSEGWSEWQLWCLMEAFGKHTHIGFNNCFETTILLMMPNV